VVFLTGRTGITDRGARASPAIYPLAAEEKNSAAFPHKPPPGTHPYGTTFRLFLITALNFLFEDRHENATGCTNIVTRLTV